MTRGVSVAEVSQWQRCLSDRGVSVTEVSHRRHEGAAEEGNVFVVPGVAVGYRRPVRDPVDLVPVCIYTSIYLSIYVYIHRERESE